MDYYAIKSYTREIIPEFNCEKKRNLFKIYLKTKLQQNQIGHFLNSNRNASTKIKTEKMTEKCVTIKNIGSLYCFETKLESNIKIKSSKFLKNSNNKIDFKNLLSWKENFQEIQKQISIQNYLRTCKDKWQFRTGSLLPFSICLVIS